MIVTAKIEGRSPLFHHSSRLVNPMLPEVKAFKIVNGITPKKKTDDSRKAEQDLEWLGGLYTDKPVEFSAEDMPPYRVTVAKTDARVVMPGDVVLAMVKRGATMAKNGKNVERGVVPCEEYYPLDYDGPRQVSKLFESAAHRDVRPAVMPSSGSRVMRCRPRFNRWALDFSLEILEDAEITADALKLAVEVAGRNEGIGDYRPRYGRFRLVAWDVTG